MYNQGQYNQGQFNPNQFVQNQYTQQGQFAQPVQPVQPTQANNDNKIKKLLPWIIVAAEAVLIAVLAILMMKPSTPKAVVKASIANDATEDVQLNLNNEVESFSAICETSAYYISFDKDNNYYIENKKVPSGAESVDADLDDLYEISVAGEVATSTIHEKGIYIVDGNNIHLKPQSDEDYWVSYKSHVLTYKEQNYDCKNQD